MNNMERQIKTLSALNTIYRGKVSAVGGRQFVVHPPKSETPESGKFNFVQKYVKVQRHKS